MKNNILEFCLSPDLGGLELFMVNCYNGFGKKTNCKVVVEFGKKLDAYINDDNKIHLKRNKFFPIAPAFRLAKLIDKHDIDIIHFHWTRDMITVVLAKVLSEKKPKIIQTRNMSMTRFKDDIYHRWLYTHIDIMHAVTHQVKKQIEKFIPEDISPRVEVVYMGTEEQEISTKKIKYLEKEYNLNTSFIIGIVGRIEEAKGQYIVIEALKYLKDLDIKIMIVGDTMDKKYLENLKEDVRDYGLEDKVIFTGFTREVSAHMKLFDVNILATPNETFGLVVIEAMMNKVTMIATNKGGPLEIISHGENGLLFDRTAEDLASKIKLLYDDREMNLALAENGYKKAQLAFESTKQLDKLFSIIEIKES